MRPPISASCERDAFFERLVPVAQLIGLLLELGRLLLHSLVRDGKLAALVVDFREQFRIAHREARPDAQMFASGR